MSVYAPDNRRARLKGALLAVLFLTVIALGFLGTALALGTEPRLVLERSEPGSFRVTGTSYFAGYQWHTRTIDGVTSVVMSSALRRGRGDSVKENQRRSAQKSLDMYGADGRRVGWDREDDQRQIEDFMQGSELRLALTDPPPPWRMGIAWFCTGFAVLIMIGAIQSNFFPKAGTSRPLP